MEYEFLVVAAVSLCLLADFNAFPCLSLPQFSITFPIYPEYRLQSLGLTSVALLRSFGKSALFYSNCKKTWDSLGLYLLIRLGFRKCYDT